MKTVTGRVISEEPISLSKAATLLSRFVSSDNGASQAVSAYLRRTSAAFTELNSIHKQNKSSSLKEMKPRFDATHDRNLTCESDDFGRADDIGLGSHFGTQRKMESNGIYGREEGRQGPRQEEEDEINEGKPKKKKKKKKKIRKNKEEDNVDGKVTQKLEGGDKAMEMETEDDQRKDESKERKKKKKKKRKSDQEMGSEEKRSKKKSKSNEIDG